MPRQSLISFDKKTLGRAPGIVGVDEAGRGSFAGPVLAAAVWVKRSFYDNATPIRKSSFINDSKQLSPRLREEIFALIKHWEDSGELLFSTGEASVQEIDELNILGATRLAMQRAIAGVLEKNGSFGWYSAQNPKAPCPFESSGDDAPLFKRGKGLSPILVDGNPLRPFAWKHRAIIKGDATSLAIALASIAAKVSRDKIMCDLVAKYPGYGFASNKGYGTPQHLRAIVRNGITPLHRIKFLRNLVEEKGDKIPGIERFFPRKGSAPKQGELPF